MRRKLALIVLMTCGVLCVGFAAWAQTAAQPYTPSVGSAERKAIFDAMRKLGDDHKRIFVVNYLKVLNGWAWLRVHPQSPDGTQHYEPESALAHKTSAGWAIVDQPCTDDGCDPLQEVARIQKDYPDAPVAIFEPLKADGTPGP